MGADSTPITSTEYTGDISTSALGSVNGKKLGLNLTQIFKINYWKKGQIVILFKVGKSLNLPLYSWDLTKFPSYL